MRMRFWIVAIVLMLAVVTPAAVALAQDGMFLCHIVQAAGGGITLDCTPYVAPPDATATPIPTDTPIPPTATAVPVPPTATAMPDMTDMTWHAPGAHGDRPAHEHGDAPPQWVLDAGYTPMFTHAAGTPGENVANYKHTAFKGWAGRFGSVDWYGVFHLDTNPVGQAGRFHSYQLWARDATGAVSSFNGWLDFGTGNSATSQKVVVCQTDSTTRPIIMVNQAGCQPRFENWYARAGGSGAWAPDIGFNISPTYYDIGAGDPASVANWQAINGAANNVNRRIEWAWYPGRSTQRGEFWATQFGDVVSGPNDPRCGTQQAHGTRVDTVLCLRQYIAPTLPEISFSTIPGPNRNSQQRTFGGGGIVVLPN